MQGRWSYDDSMGGRGILVAEPDQADPTALTVSTGEAADGQERPRES